MIQFCYITLLLIVSAHSLPNYTYAPGTDAPSIEVSDYYRADDGDEPLMNNCTSTEVCPADPGWISVVANKTACQPHFYCTTILKQRTIGQEVSEDAILLKVDMPSFTSLQSHTLYQFRKLVYLEMEFGLIETIEGPAFNRQTKLQLLNLAQNQITRISNRAFDGLTRLTTLILEKNKLASFDGLTFASLKNLEVLNLNHNSITELADDMFAGLDKLVDLKLDHNNINHIGNEALRDMGNLKVLSMKGNMIQTLPAPVLQGTPNIKILRISYNPIVKITKNTLRPLQNTLEKLFLNNCNLTTLPKKIFNNFPRLSMLILSKNKLRSLPNLGTTPAMATLDLHGNALACDDDVSPMFRWMRRHKNLSVEATCDTPKSRRNMSLSDIINPSTPPTGANQGSISVSTTNKPISLSTSQKKTTSTASHETTTATSTTAPTTSTQSSKKPNEGASTFGHWNRNVVLTIFAVCVLAILGLVVLVICKCRRNPNKHKSAGDDAISLNEQGGTNGSTTVVDQLKTTSDEEEEEELGSAEKVPVEEEDDVVEDDVVEDEEEEEEEDKITVSVVIPTVKITNSEDIEVHGGEEQES